MDSGEIIEQEGFRIDNDATLTEVVKKMHLLENGMYPRVVHDLITQEQDCKLEMMITDSSGYNVWKRAHV